MLAEGDCDGETLALGLTELLGLVEGDTEVLGEMLALGL